MHALRPGSSSTTSRPFSGGGRGAANRRSAAAFGRGSVACAATPAGQDAATQPQLSSSRRGALLQASSSVLLGSLGLWCGEAALLPGRRHQFGAALAAGQPTQLEGDVKAAVDAVLDRFVTKQKSPVLLRLAYHDAASHSAADNAGGSNASIQFELDRPENFGLKRGWNVIQEMSAALASTPAAGRVSKADLIALAGARSVAVTGGPAIALPVGRTDATAADPPGLMVSEKAGVEALKANFAAKGFGVQQMVALSGAHTLGSKGFGDPVTFDNAYYKTLLQKPWLNTKDEMATHIGLPSDHVLPDDPECAAFIAAYADDQGLFFRDFAAAYAKMTTLGVRWA